MTNKLDKGEIMFPETFEYALKFLLEFVDLVEKDTINTPKPYYDGAKKGLEILSKEYENMQVLLRKSNKYDILVEQKLLTPKQKDQLLEML